MWQVVQVSHAARGRVGEKHVEAAQQADARLDLADAPAHLLLGGHVGAVFVAHGAAQPNNAQATVHVDRVVNADAPQGRLAAVALVVVAVHVEHGTREHGDEKLQVIGIEVACRQDKVNALEARASEVVPEHAFLDVGNRKDLHGRVSPVTPPAERPPPSPPARDVSSTGCQFAGRMPSTLSLSQSMETTSSSLSLGEPAG